MTGERKLPRERPSARTFHISRLSREERSRLARELYPVHNRIFAGLDEAGFFRYVFESGAEWTKLRIYRDDHDYIVGYAAIDRHRRTVLGKRIIVFRAAAGLLPEYRGQDSTFSFYLLEILKYVLLHPFQQVYYLGVLVHPSSYLVFAQNLAGVHPRRGCQIPEDTYRFMVAMVDSFDVPSVDPTDPLIRGIGWTTRRARPFWESTTDPDVAFFRQRNPGYRRGNGLVTLVPLTVANMLRALCSHAWKCFRKGKEAL